MPTLNQSWDDAMAAAAKDGKELPSKKEMFILAYYKNEINQILEDHGGEALNDHYWTRSERNETYAWAMNFDFGVPYDVAKSGTRHARALTDYK